VRFSLADGGERDGVVPGASTLLAAATALGVDLDHFCGGGCSCGTCRVEIIEGAQNLTRPQGNEQMVLGHHASSRGDRLACQARLMGPVHARVPAGF